MVGEDLAAILIMTMVFTSLIAGWISLRGKNAETDAENPSTQPAIWAVEEQRVTNIRSPSGQKIVRPRSRSAGGSSPARTERPPTTAQSTNEVKPEARREEPRETQADQIDLSKRESPRKEKSWDVESGDVKNVGGGPEPASEQPDIEQLEALLTDTKKLFAVLLEEYEKLKQIIE